MNHTRMIRWVAVMVLLLCCFITAPHRAYATGNETTGSGSYGIDITLRLEGEETAEHEPDEYRQNTFLILDADSGYFLAAQYNTADRCYYLTGYAAGEEEATYFTFGEGEAAQEKLVVKGLPAGSYTIRQEKTTEGYTQRREISVELADSGSKLEGDDVDLNAEKLMEMKVNLSRGSRIPDICDCRFRKDLTAGVLLIAVGIVLCVSLFISAKRSRQKDSNSK